MKRRFLLLLVGLGLLCLAGCGEAESMVFDTQEPESEWITMKEESDSTETEPVESREEEKKDPTEIMQDKIGEKKAVIESLFHVAVDGTLQITGEGNDSGKTEALLVNQDGSELEFTFSNGYISGIYLKSEPASNAKAMPTEKARSECEKVLKDIKNIVDHAMWMEYDLSKGTGLGNDEVMFYATCVMQNGVQNPGQSINIQFDKRANQVIRIVSFGSTVNTETPGITEEEAIGIALDYANGKGEAKSCELTYEDISMYSVDTNAADIYTLIYKVDMGEGITILVDAVTGEAHAALCN
ncbi:MAG: hypothetical protein E7428_00820 [Ruminococcaceae bacterium]|nr:hypothetical protein [Oscillospiraceae bacterium]